jgi:PadR family transcriptional regulator PadR
MSKSTDVWQGTLALMVLKTLETMGPQHGYGIARRIEQTSGDLLTLNYGTLYPALLKLEQEGYISSEWGVSENNRKAKFYRLTRAGKKQVEREAREWDRTTASLAPISLGRRGTFVSRRAPGCGDCVTKRVSQNASRAGRQPCCRGAACRTRSRRVRSAA